MCVDDQSDDRDMSSDLQPGTKMHAACKLVPLEGALQLNLSLNYVQAAAEHGTVSRLGKSSRFNYFLWRYFFPPEDLKSWADIMAGDRPVNPCNGGGIHQLGCRREHLM